MNILKFKCLVWYFNKLKKALKVELMLERTKKI